MEGWFADLSAAVVPSPQVDHGRSADFRASVARCHAIRPERERERELLESDHHLCSWQR